ncbi:MAG: methylmalonyl-CoA mutase family protein, partial [Firmicutes bacterium]|nr:methylmalonyl-CoA mutase family protein [Bacillota bacterium]
TQQIIAYETGVANTVDPLAGSYFVEALTSQLENEAESYFQRIEEMGGVLEGIENGFFQREIAEASYRYQKELENHEQIMVGVNAFVEEETDRISLLKIDPAVEKSQVSQLARFKATRDSGRVGKALNHLTAACRDSHAPIMPEIIEAVRASATEGEIVQSMKDVFGGWRERPVF